jgi:hypothetical protein
MMPFMTQPAVAPACYVPKAGIAARSLLLRADPAYLQRTPTVVGNRKLACLDLCVAPANQGTNRALLVAGDSTSDYVYIDIASADTLRVWIVIGGVTKVKILAVPVFRDVSTYHLRVVLDVENATAADRVRLYQDGMRLPVSGTLALVPTDLLALGNTVTHRIGRTTLSGYIDQYAGLMADLVLVSGAVPDVFGERNIHGVWVRKPKSEIQAAVASVGGFGTNGFHLDFSDPLNPGKDVSGQGNHWNAVGFDATGKDSVASSPTNVYATLNPLAEWSSNVAVSNGGLTATGVSTTDSGNGVATLAANVPTYFEARLDAVNSQSTGVGLVETVFPPNTGAFDGVATWWVSHSQIRDAKGLVVGSLTGASGDVAMVAYNPVLGYVWFGKNGTWFNDGKPNAGTNPSVTGVPSGARPRVNVVVSGGASQITVNFGQRPFAYAPPVGFKPLCTDNLPEPDIKDPGEAFAQVATTGAELDALLNTMTGHWNGAPYVEIVKRRDAAEDWRVRFSDDPGNAWATNNANAKAAAPALAAAGNYVGYRLRVGARYGVWTAEVEHVTGTATTVSHGLNTTRAVVIATRVSAGGGDRYVWHPNMAAGILGKLNSNTQPTADGTLTAFSATSFQIASAAPSGTYRVLVLAHRPGWLEIGSYKGNGTADGGYDAMGIAPLWQLIKRLDNSGAWMQSDTAHSPTNPMVKHFDMDKPNSEINAGYDLDMVVGGVKYRTNGYSSNDAGGTYLRIAIGRPVGGVCVAPATAR